MSKRMVIVGDIHGCHLELRKLLAKVDANPTEDEIWSIGDAFDRAGKYDAQKVYEVFQEYGIRYIFGNHDAELLDKVTNNKSIVKPWYKDWWESFSDEAKLWFKSSEKYYYMNEEFKVLLVHAGVDSVIPIHQTPPRTLCTLQCIAPRGMNRHRPYERLKKDGSNRAYYWTNWLTDELNSTYKDMKIVFGHSVHWPKDADSRLRHFDKINVTTMNVDWGCVHKGQLACAVIEKDRSYFESVDSEKDYYFESYKQK